MKKDFCFSPYDHPTQAAPSEFMYECFLEAWRVELKYDIVSAVKETRSLLEENDQRISAIAQSVDPYDQSSDKACMVKSWGIVSSSYLVKIEEIETRIKNKSASLHALTICHLPQFAAMFAFLYTRKQTLDINDMFEA